MSIIFLEGTSGVGKTTYSSKTFDYMKYLQDNPEYVDKHTVPHLQILYDTHIHLDLINNLVNLEENDFNKDIMFDRCFISQFVYNILFKHSGEKVDLENFKFNIENNVFSKPEYKKLLKSLLEKFLNLVTFITGRPSTIYWCISNDVEFTECAMRSRKGFEIEREKTDGWNIKNYIYNQNYLFEKLYEYTGVGKLVKVEKYLNTIL